MRTPARWRLRTRLLLVLVLITALGLTAFGVLSLLLLDRAQLQRVDSQLNLVATDLTAPTRPPPPRLPQPASEQVPSEFRLLFFDLSGTSIGQLGAASGPSTYPALPPMDLESVRARGDAPFTVPDRSTETQWRVSTFVRLPNEGQPAGGTAAVALSLADSEAISGRLRSVELVVGAGLLVGMSVLAALLVRVGLRPLTKMEHAAEAIAAGDLDLRVQGTDPLTETGRLGAAFNVMVGRLATALRQLEDSEQRMRVFVADASHELRTPLTTVRGYAELYRRGAGQDARALEVMGRIESAAIRMGVLVDELLLLADLDEERPLDLVETDLVVVTDDVVRDARSRSPDRVIRFSARTNSVAVIGDDHRLRQVVANLVNNALVHTSDPAEVTVTVFVEVANAAGEPPAAEAGGDLPPAPEYAVIEVADNGPGMSADVAPHVFDRFYQGTRSRSRTGSSGLGLSITAAILAAHRARIQLRTEYGNGASFRVLFPLAGHNP
ncbi:sensor histidine kinase [Nocardia fluminea]|uniref:sensor histidine kinase n=1 Tax=Nocardia fluminea TaxID=134984 RepID=UPI003651F4DA